MSFIGKDNYMRRVFKLFLWLTAIAGVPSLSAVAHAGEVVVPKTLMAKEQAGDMVQGDVLKVIRDLAKVVIKHREMIALSMPARTMVFSIPDAALLDSLQAGVLINLLPQVAPHGFAVTEIESV